jgi:hypothetical protein
MALKEYTKATIDLCVQDRELLVSDVISLSIKYKASKRKKIHKEERLTVWDRLPVIFIPFPLFFFLSSIFPFYFSIYDHPMNSFRLPSIHPSLPICIQ